MTGELSSALDVDENAETDPVESSLFLSGKEHAWIRFSVDPEHGISKECMENGTVERGIPLVVRGSDGLTGFIRPLRDVPMEMPVLQ